MPFTAHALDVNSIDINGFGSIIGSMTSDEDENLYGIDDEFDFQNESRFAVQVSSRLSEKWSATAQILARGEDQYDPTFEWAYLSYEATSNLKLFFGRQRFKQYKYSGYVDVGYAYPWLRLPQGVYSVPFSSGDGVGAAYQTYAGDLEVNLQYNILGSTIDDFVPSTGGNPSTIDIQLSHILSLDFNFQQFNFGANFAYIPELSYDILGADPRLQGVFGQNQAGQDALDGLVAQGLISGAIANDVRDLKNDDIEVFTWDLYAGWDNGDVFVLAEYSDQNFSESSLADQESWYFTGGYRFGQYTFHATYGQDKNDASTDAADQLASAVNAAVPPGFQPDSLVGLVAGVNALQNAQVEDSEFYIFGVRYDFDAAVALKADYTTVMDDDNPQREAEIFAVGLDFVF
ncbi:hypothetical protein GCM10022278_04360 [Allohahella marinimesophila]|uniref:Porin n=2 Tax=Allohahella marinimesophila TaxID=1054972 RepID=A0ABP7NJ35_9GAMM